MTAAVASGLLLTGCGGAGDAETPREGRQDVRRDAPPADAAAATAGVPAEDAEELADEPGDAPANNPTSNAPATETPSANADSANPDPTNPWAGTSPPSDGFLMPSGNVACGLGAEWVACQIRDRDYVPSPVFAGCAASEADTILLRTGESPTWICSEHDMFSTAYEFSGPTVQYGETYYGPTAFTCASESTGVECSDADHGFRLARASWESW